MGMMGILRAMRAAQADGEEVMFDKSIDARSARTDIGFCVMK